MGIKRLRQIRIHMKYILNDPPKMVHRSTIPGTLSVRIRIKIKKPCRENWGYPLMKRK